MPSSSPTTERYLLDTSAILAHVLNEAEAPRVAAICKQAAIPFMAYYELYAALWTKFGQAKADHTVAAIREWHLPWIWPSEESVLLAGRWRVRHRLGLADAFIAALAFTHHLTLVTKDLDFLILQSDLKLLYLR